MKKENNLDRKLLNRDIQPTAMRLLVLKFLIRRDAAVSLSDLEKHFERSDRITLYRTLRKFEEHGLVHQIHDESGSAKYALCPDDCDCTYPDDTHVHFHCSKCDRTYCFSHLSVPPISLPENFRATSGNFVISGYCPSCYP